MFMSLRVRLQRQRLERAFEEWQATPLPPDLDLTAQIPSPDVLTAEQFAHLAGVSTGVASTFLEHKAAEFGIQSDSMYFQGGPYWIEYRFPKKSAARPRQPEKD